MRPLYKYYIKDLKKECYGELEKIFGRVPRVHKKWTKRILKKIKEKDIEAVDSYLYLKNFIKITKGIDFSPYSTEQVINKIFESYELEKNLERINIEK